MIIVNGQKPFTIITKHYILDVAAVFLARNRRDISKLSDCNGTGTHNHSVRKQTLNQTGQMVECSFTNIKWCGFKFRYSHLKTYVFSEYFGGKIFNTPQSLLDTLLRVLRKECTSKEKIRGRWIAYEQVDGYIFKSYSIPQTPLL